MNPLWSQSISATPTYHNLGLQVVLESPSPETVIRVAVRPAGSTAGFQEAHPLSRLSSTTHAGSVFHLTPGTTYDLRLSSPAWTQERLLSVTTRAERFPDATNRTYHVAPTGNDAQDGTTFSRAFRTLAKALSLVQPGTTILLHDGTFHEGDLTIPRSGTPTAPIVLRNAPGERPVLDGTDTQFVPAWTVHDAVAGVYRSPCTQTPENAYLNGEQLFHFLALDDLRTRRWGQSSGYHTDGAFLYVRLPGGGAPGTNQITLPAHTTGLTLDQQSWVQIRGLEFAHFGRDEFHRGLYLDGADSNLVDHCVFRHNGVGVALKRAADFNTIQYCTFTESPVDTWSWHAVKEGGVGYEAGGVLVYGSAQPNRGNVIRHCTFTRLFDGAHLYSENPNGPTENLDFHDNLIRGCADDAVETDGAGSNCRLYHNRFEDFLTGVSVAPCAIGPTYLFRNVLIGWHPIAEFEGYPFKFNVSSSLPIEWVYLYHNTCFTEAPDQPGFLFKQYSRWTNIVARNNLFAGTAAALESWSAQNPVDFDYDVLHTSGTPLVRWNNTAYPSLSAFTAATGQEAHGLVAAPEFISPAAGDYYPRLTSPLLNRAQPIPGINDGWIGAGPDVGAFEYGMEADAFVVESGAVTLTWRVSPASHYQLQLADDPMADGWANLGPPRRSQSPSLVFQDEGPNRPQRYYRLLRVFEE